MKTLGVAILSLLAPIAHACLWDSDTLAMEAKANLDVIATVGGWFDRNPPAYYEMRLARVSQELIKHPENLDLYDDAGVACERLDRQDEAIEWMGKKRAQMGSSPPATHHYRYLSNLGTFHLHRWAKQPNPGANLDHLRNAIDLITEALIVEPNAHFGRERVQLALMRWLLEGHQRITRSKPHLSLLNYVDEAHRETTDVMKGLCGLVQMGFAWESIDVFFWLAKHADSKRDRVIAKLIRHRMAELTAKGAKPLYPWSPREEPGQLGPPDRADSTTNRAAMPTMEDDLRPWGWLIEKDVADSTSSYFATLREAADAHYTSRATYMSEAFAAGLHPDTHPTFWDRWHPLDQPPVPADSIFRPLQMRQSKDWLAMTSLMSALVLGPLYLIRRLSKARAHAKASST